MAPILRSIQSVNKFKVKSEEELKEFNDLPKHVVIRERQNYVEEYIISCGNSGIQLKCRNFLVKCAGTITDFVFAKGVDGLIYIIPAEDSILPTPDFSRIKKIYSGNRAMFVGDTSVEKINEILPEDFPKLLKYKKDNKIGKISVDEWGNILKDLENDVLTKPYHKRFRKKSKEKKYRKVKKSKITKYEPISLQEYNIEPKEENSLEPISEEHKLTFSDLNVHFRKSNLVPDKKSTKFSDFVYPIPLNMNKIKIFYPKIAKFCVDNSNLLYIVRIKNENVNDMKTEIKKLKTAGRLILHPDKGGEKGELEIFEKAISFYSENYFFSDGGENSNWIEIYKKTSNILEDTLKENKKDIKNEQHLELLRNFFLNS